MSDAVAAPVKKKRRWLRVLLVLFVLFVVLPLGLAWYAVTAKPAYWNPADGKRPDVRAMAERLEQMVSSELTRVRDAQSPWKLDLEEGELNAWLAARLPQWAANRGVDQQALDQIARSMVHIEPGTAEVAMELEVGGVGGVVRLRYEPAIGEGQRIRLVLKDAHAGLIPFEVSTLLDSIVGPYLPQQRKGQLHDVRSRVESIDLLIPLGDGRVVDVVGLELFPGRAMLICRTHR